MMDFDNILDIASQNQGLGSVQQKRYSLQVGPPKKDPRSKGVNPAAVQALLKKKNHETIKKEIQFKKQKDELAARRVELKSDRKARAMASRTKDNFRGYNGIPVVETPKKRRKKTDIQEEASLKNEIFKNQSIDPDDEDNFEYEQTDSETEQEPDRLRPGKTTSGNGNSGKLCSKKNSGPSKSAPPPMNFADLLKLAEKKQFEPVDLKLKVVKKEERLRTADEIRELEVERKAKRQGKDREGKSQSSSNLIRKGTLEKDQKSCKTQKNCSEKPNLPTASGKKPHQILVSNRSHSSTKPTVGDRDKERSKTSHSDRPKTSTSMSSGSMNSKTLVKPTPSQVTAKQVGSMSSLSHKSTTSDLSLKKEMSSLNPGRTSGIPGTRHLVQKSQHGSSHQTRPSQSSSLKQEPTVRGHKSGKGEPLRPGVNAAVKSCGNSVMRTSSDKAGCQPQSKPGPKSLEGSSGKSVMRTSSGCPPKAGGQLQARPGGTLMAKAGGARPAGRGSGPPRMRPGQPGRGGLVPGRSPGSTGSGPGRPKCTVVSETISSKNVGGPRMGIPTQTGMPQRPGMASRSGMPYRPMMSRPPGTMLPPITSPYEGTYEDEDDEYDSEMDDFIDDGAEEQEEISRHIKEIFGYDRKRYKNESDYALKFMESSWKEMQKEEARSLKLAVQEDLEEEKREEEEQKRNAKRKRMN
ncbi:protein SPT2 homolog [Antennarius striatus]|uniref:protein SPT2 homolog n=1 Tax=Antennarius striatus TaxID=241820 RepID=UPI0035B03591